MLHIVKQFMTGLTVMLKSEFAETLSSEADQPEEVIKTKDSMVTPEAAEIISDTSNALDELSQEVNLNKKILSLSIGDLANISSIISTGETIDKNSPGFDRKGAQSLLVFLGRDISFTNTAGIKIEGEDAIDGFLGETYSRVIEQLQADLGANITGELDQQTQAKLQPLIDNAIKVNHEFEKANPLLNKFIDETYEVFQYPEDDTPEEQKRYRGFVLRLENARNDTAVLRGLLEEGGYTGGSGSYIDDVIQSYSILPITREVIDFYKDLSLVGNTKALLQIDISDKKFIFFIDSLGVINIFNKDANGRNPLVIY